MKFALYNESTFPSLTKQLLTDWAGAYVLQLGRDFSSMWQTLGADIDLPTDLSGYTDDACIVHFVNRIPEAPDALAYHTRDNRGRPLARVGVLTNIDAGLTIDDVSESASHEILEAWEDPYCTEWVDYDGVKMVADEVCDPVQGSGYRINGVQVANFVGSRWRDAKGSAGPFDFRNVLTAPLSRLSTGYLAFDDGTQDLGSMMHAAKKLQAQKYSRRSGGRIVTL